MNSRYDKFENPVTLGEIAALSKAGRDEDARELVYRIITEDPDLTAEWIRNEKKFETDAIDRMIEFYESVEEYEHCAALKSVLDRVRNK